MEELKAKVLNEKYAQMPNYVPGDFQKIIRQCLQKKEERRPPIEEIILSDVFQSKCRLLRITLPLEINKEKLVQKGEKEAASFAAKKQLSVKPPEDSVKSCCAKHTEFMKACKYWRECITLVC